MNSVETTRNLFRIALLIIALTSTAECKKSGFGGSSPQCDCLPNQVSGRFRIASLDSSKSGGEAEWLALFYLLDNMQQDITNEVIFKLDLVYGLLVFESPAHKADDIASSSSSSSSNHNWLRRWALVVDFGQSSSSQPSKVPLIYIIDKDSNNVRRVDNGIFGDIFSGNQFELNRCPMSTDQLRDYIIDEASLVYLINNPESYPMPILLAMAAESCLPRVLSDISRVAVAFEIIDNMEVQYESLLLLDALYLRAYLSSASSRPSDEESKREMPQMTLDATGLLLRLLMKKIDKQHEASKGCCTPRSWQASMAKTVIYKLMGIMTGTQTTIMDRIYVDHDEQAIAGRFYYMLDNQPVNNSTFLAQFDREITHSVVIYVVDVATNTCFAANLTGINSTGVDGCFSKDVANYTGDMTLAMSMTVSGWSKQISNGPGYNGTINFYVTEIEEPNKMKVMQDLSKMPPTCVTVSEMATWNNPIESVSSTAFFYNTQLGVPDNAFTMPTSCIDVPVMDVSRSQASEVMQSIIEFTGSL